MCERARTDKQTLTNIQSVFIRAGLVAESPVILTSLEKGEWKLWPELLDVSEEADYRLGCHGCRKEVLERFVRDPLCTALMFAPPVEENWDGYSL